MQHKGSVFYDFDFSIKRPLYSIRQLFRDLKCCLERIRKGYCVKDLWEIDTWFLGIMPEMLEEFDRRKNSYPNAFWEQCVQKHESELPVSKEKFLISGARDFPDLYKKISAEAYEAWGNTLQEMADLMRKAQEIKWKSVIIGEEHLPYQKKALELFQTYFDDLWD